MVPLWKSAEGNGGSDMTARAMTASALKADQASDAAARKAAAEAARKAAEEAARKAAEEAARKAAEEAARRPLPTRDNEVRAAARANDGAARSSLRLEEPAPAAKVARGAAVDHHHVDRYSDDVKVMQQRMQAAGINPGPIDGLKGPLTRAAMAAYEKKFGKSAAEGLKVDPAFEEVPGSERVAAGGGVDSSVLGKVSGTVKEWIAEAKEILIRAGVPAHRLNEAAIATIIRHESGGNPRAVNNWDSNARKGTPSKGLMQTIQPTFDRWKLPGMDQIMNPVHNIVAGVRYALNRYGSLENVPGIRSMARGGAYKGY
ncbi:MAG: transglycosylase SLT domain-containing protein [Candidatus Sericytochromatia bacterium]|nr:transglycosylase SLT domain-containing protein [Candidatus Sericytochromatia bacterium]